jgi:hypothetical protein
VRGCREPAGGEHHGVPAPRVLSSAAAGPGDHPGQLWDRNPPRRERQREEEPVIVEDAPE